MVLRERMRELVRYDSSKEEMQALMFGDYMNKIEDYLQIEDKMQDIALKLGDQNVIYNMNN